MDSKEKQKLSEEVMHFYIRYKYYQKISALSNKFYPTFLNKNLNWTVPENTYLFLRHIIQWFILPPLLKYLDI